MDITLAHGTANDFVVYADLDDRRPLTAGLARALCDRRRGIGADGVLRLGPGVDGGQVFMDHRNADGSTAEMCGNGVRVVAKHVIDHGLVTPDEAGVVRVATRGGLKPVMVDRGPDGRVAEVTVDMGPPILDPAEVPFEAEDPDALLHPIDLDVEVVDADGAAISSVEVAVVSMGNPHAVLRVADVDRAPVERLGPLLESHRRFPAKANIGFAQVLDRSQIRLRVFERGVGETAACGTGACAAVVALQRLGELDDEVAVHVPGGTLRIHHAGGTVSMTGPAVEVAHGHLDDAWLAAHVEEPTGPAETALAAASGPTNGTR